MLPGRTHLAVGRFTLTVFAAVSSAAPSCDSDNGSVALRNGYRYVAAFNTVQTP